MKIGINTLFLIPNKVGGTEYFTRSFIETLQKIDKKNDYIIFCNPENFDTFNLTNKRWKKVKCPIKAQTGPSAALRILYEQIMLPFLVNRYKCDILHSYGYFGPVFCPAKHIVTVHDLNWRDHPENLSTAEKIGWKIFVESSLFTANFLLVDSDFSYQRMHKNFPQYLKKTRVIKAGVDERFRKGAKKIFKHPLSRKKYILYVSAFYPHKNAFYMLEIWKKLSNKEKKLNLVLVGQNGSDQEMVLNKIKQLPRIHYFPKVPIEKLISFYQHCQAFIMPSAYEGFGFPVYEALFIGKPTWVLNKSIYDKSVQPELLELKGNSEQDSLQILESFSMKIKITKMLNYTDSAKKLLKLYSK